MNPAKKHTQTQEKDDYDTEEKTIGEKKENSPSANQSRYRQTHPKMTLQAHKLTASKQSG